VKSILDLPFWYRLTRVVPDKGPLNACVAVCVCVCLSVYSDVPVTVSRCLCINRATPAGPQLRRARRQRTGTFTAAAITRETPHTKSPVARNKSRVKRSRVAAPGTGLCISQREFTAVLNSLMCRAFNCRISYGLHLPTVILTVIWYSIAHSLFLSRLKTFLLCKSFPLQPFLSST